MFKYITNETNAPPIDANRYEIAVLFSFSSFSLKYNNKPTIGIITESII